MVPLAARFVAWGARRAVCLPVSEIPFDPSFLTLCVSNACGRYGKNHTCPPGIGAIDDLIADAKTFHQAVVYQTVATLEDSYDIEGMLAAGRRHNDLVQSISRQLRGEAVGRTLHLGVGGCWVCPICAKVSGEACRAPELALRSLEAYGIDVSTLAARCGLKYIHGPNTVTYFGVYLY